MAFAFWMCGFVCCVGCVGCVGILVCFYLGKVGMAGLVRMWDWSLESWGFMEGFAWFWRRDAGWRV